MSEALMAPIRTTHPCKDCGEIDWYVLPNGRHSRCRSCRRIRENIVRPTPEQRFWSRVDQSGECWIWTLSLNGDGYGYFAITTDKNVRAHRIAYELTVGPIPAGLELDHLCRNRACVRPDHLEPVTHAENVRRAAAAARRKDEHYPYRTPESEDTE